LASVVWKNGSGLPFTSRGCGSAESSAGTANLSMPPTWLSMKRRNCIGLLP
jgi:hypothetical protein